jgi:hypothetical protein
MGPPSMTRNRNKKMSRDQKSMIEIGTIGGTGCIGLEMVDFGKAICEPISTTKK